MPSNPYGIDYSALSNLFNRAQPQQRQRPRTTPLLGVENDPSLEVMNLLNEQRAELRGRLRKGSTYNPDELRDISTGLEQVEEDIAASPITRQGAEIADLERRGKEAALEGFANAGDPGFIGTGGYAEPIQRKAAHAREMATRELERPIRQAEVAAGPQYAQVEAEKGKAVQGMDLLKKFMSGEGSTAAGPGPKSITVPGVGSFSWQTTPRPAQISPGVHSMVTKARADLEAAENRANAAWTDFSGSDARAVEQARSVYEQALGGVFGPHPADYGIKELAMSIGQDPQLAQLPLGVILGDRSKPVAGFDISDLTLTEEQQLNELLTYLRGPR